MVYAYVTAWLRAGSRSELSPQSGDVFRRSPPAGGFGHSSFVIIMRQDLVYKSLRLYFGRFSGGFSAWPMMAGFNCVFAAVFSLFSRTFYPSFPNLPHL